MEKHLRQMLPHEVTQRFSAPAVVVWEHPAVVVWEQQMRLIHVKNNRSRLTHATCKQIINSTNQIATLLSASIHPPIPTSSSPSSSLYSLFLLPTSLLPSDNFSVWFSASKILLLAWLFWRFP